MMKNCLIALCLIFFISCEEKKSRLDIDYKEKKELLKDFAGSYFKNLEESNLTEEERHYLKFLFTYMPLSDFGDYDFEFFLNHVRYSIKAKDAFEWTKNIPEDIFMQYVLPPRMNNENMDTGRMVFFYELKERLLPMNLSMEQASLEVNHWCHEKVSYRPTDGRTISPLGAIKSAFGRCGEESTFTTTALRAVGIPARQAYTPRWAHTDDNHAWVEVWIDGKWYFMGACEPSPKLNMGWFEIPSTRAMLIHTKQFGKIGKSYGSENYISETDNFTWINTLDTYAPVKVLEVLVVDENGKSLEGVNVQFQLYNYAEMYSLHKEKTDKFGKVKFKTGCGSLDIYVDNGKNFVSRSIAPEEEGLIEIVLAGKNIYPSELAEYTPPAPGEPQKVDTGLEVENEYRLLEEDAIRTEYEATFYTQEKAKIFAEKYNFSEDVIDYLVKSRGNYAEIEMFLIDAAKNFNQDRALRLLKVIAEKDLRDIRANILKEHLDYAFRYLDENIPIEIFDNYVLNPRIMVEMLTPYRKLILDELTDSQIKEFRNNPEKIKEYVKSEIKTQVNSVDGDFLNAYSVAITPSGVHKLKLSDNKSFKIYFVALCRSLGVPARIEQATGFTQIYFDNGWKDILFEIQANEESKIGRGKIKLLSAYENRELKYRIHFSLSLLENAEFKTVDLGWEVPISEFSEGIELQAGEYMLLSSVRREDGSVVVKREYYELKEGETLIIIVGLPDVSFNKDSSEKFVDSQIFSVNGEIINSESLRKNDNSFTVFCWLDSGKEPSKHIVRDLTPMINELKNNSIYVYFIVNEDSFNPERHGFSKGLNYLYDKDFKLLYKNIKCSSAGNNNIIYPQVKMINSDGDIIFATEGYTIGIGEMIMSKIL